MNNDPSNILLDLATILVGDVFDCLRAMPDESVDIIVTSPPYWGLRDYEVDGQIGMEPTLGEHIAKLVEVSAELHRVLKSSGVYFLNYGDCYATKPNGRSAAETKAIGNDDRTFRDKPFSTVGPIHPPSGDNPFARDKGGRRGGGNNSDPVLKPKDLCMAPNRLAIALQEWGWWVRAENVWGKPNPMPESIDDRPATSHEKVFMLTKSERYYYNAVAVRQGATESSERRWAQDIDNQEGSHRAHAGKKVNGTMKAVGGPRTRQDRIADAAGKSSSGRRMKGFNERWDAKERGVTPRHAGHINHTGIEDTPRGSRSLRNWEPAPLEVWRIATRPFSEAHFATFPPELVERCLLAGCPPGGVVLDPFGGAGTTSLVAGYMGFRSIMIELNEGYADIARRRLVQAVSKISTPKSDAVGGDDPTDFFQGV